MLTEGTQRYLSTSKAKQRNIWYSAVTFARRKVLEARTVLDIWINI